MDKPPLIAHIIYYFDIGGMENGLVNLINRIPVNRYRHAIICLQDYSVAFAQRLKRNDVELVALHKQPGQDFFMFLRLRKVLQQLQPDIVHTRNLAALECQLVARWMKVPGRVHSEHGRDIFDVEGKNRKYTMLRQWLKNCPQHYIGLSQDLANWLVEDIEIPAPRVSQIYNGVDAQKFHPVTQRPEITPPGFLTPDCFVIGSVGRMAEIKDYPTLVRAFLLLLEKYPQASDSLRLVIVGDGAVRAECQQMLEQAGVDALAWLPGAREDIPACLQLMDVMVLPSLGEGISNTILEAMASGVPVIATEVGGNVELVQADQTGYLVSTQNAAAIAEVIWDYYQQPALCREHGDNARHVIEHDFCLDVMVERYLSVYDQLLT